VLGATVPCSFTGGPPSELGVGVVAFLFTVGLGEDFGIIIPSGAGLVGDEDTFFNRTGAPDGDGGRAILERVGYVVGEIVSVSNVTVETTFPVGSYVVLSTDPHSFFGLLNMEQKGSATSFATVHRNRSSNEPCLQPSPTMS
jgi:hypothetical protein